MRYIVDAAKMKAIDNYTMNEVGIPSLVLMERAAMSVVDAMLKSIDKNDKILCVCGTGNNGGDGIAVARILYHKGFRADIFLLGEEDKASKQTKEQLLIARNMGVNIFNQLEIDEYNIIVDGIFGIGLSRDIKGDHEKVIKQINSLKNYVYAIDIPSGINADNGKIMNISIQADETITFGYCKVGLLLYPGKEYSGNITVKDIGLVGKSLEAQNPAYFVYEEEDLNRLPIRKKDSNKGSYGRVLIIAGSKNMSGACYLSAKAAYRAGAGLVKVLTDEENRSIIQSQLPETILATYDLSKINQSYQTDIILDELAWASVIVIGPGIGESEGAKELLQLVLEYSKVPTIIDADGINLLTRKKEYCVEKKTKDFGDNVNLSNRFILTPHIKEMSRIMHCPVSKIVDNLLPVAVWATKDKEYILALKDARTIVTSKGKVYVNTSGNNGMSTAGSGDVLTGIIAAFLAGGIPLYDATTLGVYVHGLAGDAAMKEKGVYSLMASDIIEALSYVVRN